MVEPWRGAHSLESPRILLLGESHYDDEKEAGDAVTFSTAEIVEKYCNPGRKRSQFFNKIAASFGYDSDGVRYLFDKVFFGNYIDVVCGIGDSNAKYYAAMNRQRYNDEWFDFVNENNIEVIICFSKLVYNSFPSLTTASERAAIGRSSVGKIGSRQNYIEFCKYDAGIDHPFCSTKLKAPLKVYGVRHPSARGGYDAVQVLRFLREQADVRVLCAGEEITTKTMGGAMDEQVPEAIFIEADQICVRFFRTCEQAICSKNLINSFYQYVRAFCLMLAVRCSSNSDISYRHFINHITLTTLSEMSDSDYKSAVDRSTLHIYDSYLMADHAVTRELKAYDAEYGTCYFNDFLEVLSALSRLFVKIDENNASIIENSVSPIFQELKNPHALPIQPLQNSSASRAGERDAGKKNGTATNKYQGFDRVSFVRVFLPSFATSLIALYGFCTSRYIALLFALIPLVITVRGVKSLSDRCPNCQAWNSMYVVNRTLIEKNKVKVRRPLCSAYFRASGKTTFGVRQTFVSAEESVYNTVIRCRVCGYETSSLQTVIDDKIRK